MTISNVLLKVYLSAIAGHVPLEITQAIHPRCMLHCSSHWFGHHCTQGLWYYTCKFYTFLEVFHTSGVQPTGFSLPWQHSLSHYSYLIKEFGAPGGVCSSITESWHITTVKKTWHHSNHYKALGQMLVTNQQLDKLAAARVDFVNHGMLDPNFQGPFRLQYQRLGMSVTILLLISLLVSSCLTMFLLYASLFLFLLTVYT